MKKLIVYSLALLVFSCVEPKNPYTSLAPGIWRATLNLSKEPRLSLKDEVERYEKEKNRPMHDLENELPFLFEVKYENQKPTIEIINDTERIRVEDIFLGRNRTTAEDTVFIDFPVFDSQIRAIYREGIIQGDWVVRSKLNYSIPFTAHFGKDQRFDVMQETPVVNLTGIWECNFDLDSKNPYKAIGEFTQIGKKLTGTFRTETGDYRYLDGIVTGNKFYMSTFDGSHAFLFFGKIMGDSLLGTFKSGIHSVEIWEGMRNSNASLKPAASLTKATGKKVEFSFLNQEKKLKSMADYPADIKILQIMGTWCPNCYDETKFITSYLKNHPDQNIQVVALACERYRDTAKALKAINTYKTKMNIPYDILLASTTTNMMETNKQIPFLDTIISYPTMVILNKNDQVEYVHTGIDGPATSKYKEFVSDFESMITNILNKKL
ncbi:MAG: TlpA disulfide reductase family protein [Saprospiraceae bacterium]